MKQLLRSFVAIAIMALVGAPLLAETLGPISEENPPAACDPGWFITTVQCSGSYCDNITIRCGRISGVMLGRAVWTPFVSEENGRRACPANHYIAGLACNGRYCDNVSLYCVEAINLSVLNCRTTRKVSEEGSGRLFLGEGIVDAAGQRIAARAMQCSGSYCDDKAFEVCEVGVR